MIKTELFDFVGDYRFDDLKDCFRANLDKDEQWFPSAKELSSIADMFKVLGTDALTILKKAVKRYVKDLEIMGELNIEFYVKNVHLIDFYKNKLKNELKSV